MLCSRCSKKAVFSSPALCSEHLVSHVHELVLDAISRFSLFSRDDSVLVAASGGKDSVALLDVLSSLGFRVSALAVDEGIVPYRLDSLSFLRSFCSSRGIPLRVVSFEDFFGGSLDSIVASSSRIPCSVCGVFRRYLLNKFSEGFSVIATGHNLDDEAQSVLMNLLKDNFSLLSRFSPKASPGDGFVPRVKPFFLVPERLLRAYVVVRGIDVSFEECPYVRDSFRAKVRDLLNELEFESSGFKFSLVNAALRFSSSLDSSDSSVSSRSFCSRCGSPSAGVLCRACLLKDELGLS